MTKRGLAISQAGPADDPELRALLRDQPLPGWVSLSFEREPDYFAAKDEEQTVLLARERGPGGVGPLVGICARTLRRVFVDGEPRRLGYLGQFRAAPGWQRGFRAYRLLKAGFEVLQGDLPRTDELPYDLTSILSDNRAARRILTAGLKGLPRYEPLVGLHTLVYRCSARGRRERVGVESGTVVGLAAIARHLQCHYREFQLAPVWDLAALHAVGLQADDFLVVREEGHLIACAALWDQRASRQVVVRDYRRAVAMLRPLLNVAVALLGLPRLPRRGAALQQAWLSHIACDSRRPDAFRALLGAALARGRRAGIEQLLLGLVEGHPLLPVARVARRHLVYRSDLFVVRLRDPAARHCAAEPDGRPLFIEAAIL